MKLWMSAEVWHEVGDDLWQIRKLAESLINNELDSRKMQIDNVDQWAVITILLPDDFPWSSNYPETKRFHRKQKVLEFRLKIDYKSFSEVDEIGKLQLLFDMLLRSVELMATYKIPQDKINMLKEICLAAAAKARTKILADQSIETTQPPNS
jgi:hypothetical protein